MSLEFPFKYAVLPDIGKLFYPIVNLPIKTIFGWKEVDFLVDTGADITTLPTHLLPILGIKKSQLKKSATLGVGGFQVITYEFKLMIKFGNEEFEINASAVESKDDSLPFLLGKKDIFEERFSFTIDSKRKKTIILKN